MYEGSGYYDPAPSFAAVDNHHDSNGLQEDCTIALDLDHNLGFDIDIEPVDDDYQAMDHVPPPSADPAAAAWEHHQVSGQAPQYDYGPAPDLLNLLQLPRCGGPAFPPPQLPASSNIWADDASLLYDPSSLHLGYCGGGAQGPSSVLTDLYCSLPQNYGLFSCGGGGGAEERDVVIGAAMGGAGGVFQEYDGMNVMMEMGGGGLGKGGEGKGNFVTERQRRQQLNGKYTALRALIPNPGKNDRATVVGDAIEYIKELLRTVDEFKMLIQKKKHGRERMRRLLKSEDEADHHHHHHHAAAAAAAAADVESSSMRPPGVQSSWVQRRSKESFIDVRIIEDEANIKLNQKMKPKCLLYIAKALEELQLDLVHASGGNIGDSYVFMLNTKICEGSSVYAGAIAKKLLEAMDRQYPSLAFN